jgi:hypothetical protein
MAKELKRGELITQAVRELEGIERTWERRSRHVTVQAKRDAIWASAIAPRVAEWERRWGHVLEADELKDALAFAKSAVPSNLNPLRPSRTGASIRDGQIYGSKVPPAQGQARPRRDDAA